MKKAFTEDDVLEQIKVEKRNYKKAYRDANKERIRKHQNEYWRRRALKALEEKNEN